MCFEHIVYWKRHQCTDQHCSQQDSDNALLARFLHQFVHNYDSHQGWHKSNHSKYQGIIAAQQIFHNELDHNWETSNHGDVLVCGTHYLWQHVVAQKEWSKHHSSCDSRHSAQNSCDSTEESKLNDIFGIVEGHVWRNEVVPISFLNFMHFDTHLNSPNSDKKGEQCKGSKYTISCPVWKWRLSCFASVIFWSEKQCKEAYQCKQTTSWSEMVRLLVFNFLKLWTDFSALNSLCFLNLVLFWAFVIKKCLFFTILRAGLFFLFLKNIIHFLDRSVDTPGNSAAKNDCLVGWSNNMSELNSDHTSQENWWHC